MRRGGTSRSAPADAFADALKVNRTLTNLNLAENPNFNSTPRTRASIESKWIDALTANNILLKLDLSGGGEVRNKNGLESAMRGGEHPRGESAAIEVKC